MEAGCGKKKRENWHFNALLFHPWKCVEPNQLYNIHPYIQIHSHTFWICLFFSPSHTHTHKIFHDTICQARESKMNQHHNHRSLRHQELLHAYRHAHTQTHTVSFLSQPGTRRGKEEIHTKRNNQKWKRNSYSPRKIIKKEGKAEQRKRVEWKHCWTQWVLKMLMVRLHILQAIHGCRYSHSRTHAAPFLCVYFSFMHSLCRRAFFLSLRSYYNFDVGLFSFCFFDFFLILSIRSQCLFHLLFMCARIFFLVDVFLPEMFIFLKLFFRNAVHISFSLSFSTENHFPSCMTFAIHSRSMYRVDTHTLTHIGK